MQILVTTTVVEVGVDVPNATVMVIEHASASACRSFINSAAASVAALQKSHCISVTPHRLTEEGRARLETMVRTNNGFEIAEADLQLRGPGEFSGPGNPANSAFRLPVRSVIANY